MGQEYGAKSREKMQEAFKDIPREQFREKFAEIQAKMSKEAYKEIGTVLKEDQVKRLKQIEVQVSGARAFAMSHVQER